MYYIYVLLSLKDKNYYIGQTKDVKLRFLRHQKGMIKSSKYRRPLALKFFRNIKHRYLAMKY